MEKILMYEKIQTNDVTKTSCFILLLVIAPLSAKHPTAAEWAARSRISN